ncbi:MAG: DUF4034 domain-containing protein [Desulfobacterales bacterium]|nr:DUF4034 domain-containing protein [Desulfobacterales bacterium]
MKILCKLAVIILLAVFSSNICANELEMRTEIQNNVRILFDHENFNELDLIAERYRNSSERTSSGLWKLTLFYSGFDKITRTHTKDERYWDYVKAKADKWVKHNPKSPAANIAKGIILKGYAWMIRGESWASEVPKEAWKPFKDNLQIAHKHMIDSKDTASFDPHWYVVTAHIKTGLNEGTSSFKQFINEGLDKYPNYYDIYFAAIYYLAPKWHGDKKEIERFANAAVERTKKNEGMGVYSRIYWSASQVQYDERLFMESNVVWTKMREGIFDIISAYPDSWNIQNFAFFACLAKDKETTRLLMDKMYGPAIGSAWKKEEYYNYCKEYAYTSPE